MRHRHQIRPQHARYSEVRMCWMDWCNGEIIERQLFMLEIPISEVRGVGLLKFLDCYLGPVLYARTRGGPKKPPKLVVL